MRQRRRYELVLGIYPNSRGFGFALFEGPLAPLDWAVFDVRATGKKKNRECIRRISALLGKYSPDALVLQNMSPGEEGTRRTARISDLNEAIAVLAESCGIPTFAYSRAQVRASFQQYGPPTKQLIAESIANHMPAFERYVPEVRRLWMKEAFRMGIFDAAALVLVHFQSSKTICGTTIE